VSISRPALLSWFADGQLSIKHTRLTATKTMVVILVTEVNSTAMTSAGATCCNA
jgi:hypothetical protein